MKNCEYCGKPIRGEALEITPFSDRGAAPAVFWHKDRDACARPRPPVLEESPLQRHIRRRMPKPAS